MGTTNVKCNAIDFDNHAVVTARKSNITVVDECGIQRFQSLKADTERLIAEADGLRSSLASDFSQKEFEELLEELERRMSDRGNDRRESISIGGSCFPTSDDELAIFEERWQWDPTSEDLEEDNQYIHTSPIKPLQEPQTLMEHGLSSTSSDISQNGRNKRKAVREAPASKIRPVKRKKTKDQPISIRPETKWKPYILPKVKRTKEPVTKYTKGGVEKKLGPREIGRAAGFKPAKYDWDEREQRGYYNPGSVERQLGPRDIGRSSYEVAKYDLTPKEQERAYQKVERQLGPRDIGRKDSYRVAKYDLTPKQRTQQYQRVERQLGPRDIGRKDSYQVAKYDLEPTRREMEYRKVERKLGPRDIGRKESYEVANYSWSEDTSDFLAPRSGASRSTSYTRGSVERKLGPVDIGRKESYQQPEYDLPDIADLDFLAPRLTSFNNINEPVEHKLGPVEIGRSEDFEPADYGILDSTEGLFETSPRDIQPANVQKKLGPLDIGWVNGYTPYKLEGPIVE